MAETATCSVCGSTVQGDPPLDWSSSTGPRGRTWVCAGCTRDNVRSIEAKLEQEWW